MSYLADFVQSVKSRGVLGTARWVAAGFLRVNHFLVFHIDLRRPFTPAPVDPRLELRAGTLDELVRLRTGREGLPVEFYCDQTHGFTAPFFAFWEGEIAAIHWLVFPGQRSRFLAMQPGDIELNFIVVLPEFRGHRIAQALMSYMVRWAQDAGFQRIFCVVHGTNIGQFKPMLDMGFRPVEVVSHFGHRRPKATLRYVRP
jgi:ribosomal protein S18 acetylase RimI-like enzyme